MSTNLGSSKYMTKIIKKKEIVELQNERDELSDNLYILKKAAIAGTIVKGIKETLKAIEANKCKKVFISKECDDDFYRKCIKDFCDMYSVPIIETETKYQIRDAVMLGEPSQSLIDKAKSTGKDPIIKPNCYCAAILNYGEVNEKFMDN